jgi:DnaJ-class molecular chaperone
MATCKTCSGKGAAKCPKCKGSGRVGGGVFSSSYKCNNCSGSGVTKCGVCNGKGYV